MDIQIKKSIDTINFIIKDLGLENPNRLAESLGFNRAERIYKILRGENAISKKLAEEINKKYPQYSIEFLRTGEMLKAGRDINNETLIGDKSVLAKNSSFKNSDFSGDVYKDSSAEVKILKNENENLKKQIELLEQNLKSKEEVIELLKNR